MKKKKENKVIEGEELNASTKTPEAPQRGLIVKSDLSPSLGIVQPLVSPEEAKQAWKAYQDLCKAILEPTDYYRMTSYSKGKSVTKVTKLKSAWRKLATAFNLDVEVIKEEREEKEKYFVIKVTSRVTAPNGRIVEGLGSCASNERTFTHLEHDCRTMAETRSKNRAISDMIGGGETSAEELLQMEESKKDKCPKDHAKLPEKTVKSPGRNLNRPYKRCSVCTFFEWQDEDVKPEPAKT